MKNIEIIETGKSLSAEQAQRWYHNIPKELERGILSADDTAYFSAYYREAGMLRAWRRPFFMRHYAETFAVAASYLLGAPAVKQKVIIDLGCGTGTQSIAMALMGAKVIGLDMDSHALDILMQRKRFYESESGRLLDIQVYDGDVFAFDYDALGPIDGIYSMFAFNMMQPTAGLLNRLVPGMSPGARFVIQDGNRLSWLARLPSRQREVLAPGELDRELVSRGFALSWLRGTISLPPIAWFLMPRGVLDLFDETLNSNWFWPISYMAMYEKRGDVAELLR